MMRVAYRLQLVERGDNDAPALHQWKLWQLFVYIGVAATLLGLGRALWPTFVALELFEEDLTFIFLVVAAILTTIPLLLVAMLRSVPLALTATAGMLALIAVLTPCEVTLLTALLESSGPTFADFAWINIFSSAWIVLAATSVRICGYELVPPIDERK